MDHISILTDSGKYIDRDRRSSLLQTKDNDTVPVAPPPSLLSMPTKQKIFLFSIALGDFFVAACYSLIAPFFPAEAASKGASQTVVGLIVGVYQLTGFIVAPLLGKYLTKLGSKFVFISGMFVGGTCTILFGLLNLVPAGVQFISFCFAVRIFQALGQVAFLTSSFAIIANEFPGQVSTVFGILETFFGLGMMTGPPIGGALYEVGGYLLPFLVIGFCLIVTGLVLWYVLPPQKEHVGDNKLAEFNKILRIPAILITMVTFMAGAISIGFIEPTLAPFLEQFSLSPSVVGLVFLVNSTMYALTAVLWGRLGDRWGHTKLLMLLGTSVNVICFFFIGPAPFFHSETYLSVVIVCLVLQGTAIGGQLVPSLLDMLKTAKQHGFPDDYTTYALVSGIFNAFFALGAFIGPTIGGIMDDYMGFEWAAFVVGMIELACFLLLLVYCIRNYKVEIKGETPLVEFLDSSADERKPLLTKNPTSEFF